MPKIRTIKPDLYRHVELFEAEQACGLPLRLAFTGLLTCADREGRFKWQPRVLKLDILPFDNIDFAAVLDALASAGFIQPYTVENKSYGVIPSWHKHQRINAHEPASALPEPPTSLETSTFQASCRPTAATMPTASFIKNPEMPDTVETPTAVSMKTRPTVSQELARSAQDTAIAPVTTLFPKTSFHASAAVQTVFDHWKFTFQYPHALLDNPRKRVIQQALQLGYTVEALCDAITGCARTPYHCGHNQQGQRYDGLHLILRDAEHIERFIHHCYYPPQPSSSYNDTLQRQNKRAAEQWLQQKGYA